MSLDRVRYSQVWEDHRILEEGLAISPEDDVLSITSAGDNVLALLLAGPRSVTAIDMNPSQSALLELKLRAIEALSALELATLVGLRHEGNPVSLYRGLRGRLSESARAYWDAQEPAIRSGLTQSGRLEAYIGGFATDHLPELWPEDLFPRLVEAESLDAQTALFLSEGRTDAFCERFRWYFGREMMAKHGRDPAQFVHVDGGDVGRYFLDRITWACTHTRLSDNYYVEFFLTGRYRNLEAGPPYLRPSNLARLKDGVARVRIVTGELEQMEEGSFSKANLSDIFEYMSPDLNRAVFGLLADRIRPGGRIAWWNLLVPRGVPEAFHARLRPLPELSRSLWERDRSWFYRAFHVAEAAS